MYNEIMEKFLHSLKTLNTLYMPYAYLLVGFFVFLALLRVLWLSRNVLRKKEVLSVRIQESLRTFNTRQHQLFEDLRKKRKRLHTGIRWLSFYLIIKAVFQDYRHPLPGRKSSLSHSLAQGMKLGRKLYHAKRL